MADPQHHTHLETEMSLGETVDTFSSPVKHDHETSPEIVSEDEIEETSNAIRLNSESSNGELELISDGELEKANNYMKEETQYLETRNKIQELSSEDDDDDLWNQENINKHRTLKQRGLDSVALSRKIQEIEHVLQSYPVDLERLRELAKGEGGLIQDELRKLAWPQLMQVGKLEHIEEQLCENIKEHKDYNQVVLDVKRTLKRFPPGIDEDYRYVLMDQLITLIIRVLERHPHLHYYQGYHDVAITFLLVVGEDLGYKLVERLSITHLQDFMRPSMERTTYYLTYLYPVLKRANQKLYDFLIRSGVGTVFCLPWLITWYAHTLSDYRNVVRLYDFFLATPYLMPMYIAVAIVLHREEDIYAGECDMAMQHFILSQVPDTLPFENLLRKASQLYDLYPPDEVTEEVDIMIKEKALEEERERIKVLQRKKAYALSKNPGGISGILASMSAKIYLSHKQKKVAQIFMLAFTATLATGLYGYYSNSPFLRNYLPWS